MTEKLSNQLQCDNRDISNPLVVFAGIEYKDKKQAQGLNVQLKKNGIQTNDNMYKDFGKVLYTFHCMLNYSVIYQAMGSKGTKSTLIHLGNDYNLSLKQLSSSKIKGVRTKLKTNWNSEEWFQFNVQVRKKLSKNSNYDGLIYILTCHGSQDYMINLSDGEQDYLPMLFDFFDNENCQSLREKPKIFFISCVPVGSNDVLRPSPTQAQKQVSLKNVETQYKQVLYQRLKQQVNNKETDSLIKYSKSSNIGSDLSGSAKTEDEDEKEVESKSHIQYWNSMTYRKESHFRYIYATPEGYINDQLIIDHTKGSLLIRNVTRVILDMLPHSKLLIQEHDKRIQKMKNNQTKNEKITEKDSTEKELHQQTQTQTASQNACDEDESKNKNVDFIDFEDLVINVSDRINKKSIKNFQEMKESLEKLKQMETENKKTNITNQLQCSNKNNNDSTAASTDQDFDPELLRHILYSPIIEDNNRMPYFIRLVPRKTK